MDPYMSSALERLGVAGILVVASYYMLKYFMAQLARKDSRLDDITDRFVTATRDQSKALSDFTAVLDKLTDAVDGFQERRTAQRDG